MSPSLSVPSNSNSATKATSNNDLLMSICGAALMCSTSYAVGKWRANQNGSNSTSYQNKMITSSSKNVSEEVTILKQAQGEENSNDDTDGSLEVLQSVLKMISTNWATTSTPATEQSSAVVNYKPPEELVDLLFNKNNFSCSNPSTQGNPKELIEMLSTIQEFSVETNHKFFFNQLFGALDPVSLAADLFANACCHTSAYTFETAPVMTLLEQDIIQTMRKIVYNTDKGDGLFFPGGSFSNLMAMHVARDRYLTSLKESERNSYDAGTDSDYDENGSEEKKSDQDMSLNSRRGSPKRKMVALVSDEAHYSFKKAASIVGIELVTVPTTRNGEMDVKALERFLFEQEQDPHGVVPIFVGLTAGSTVRGSYDPILRVVEACRNSDHTWVHVDGAWGGPAVFTKAGSPVRKYVEGVELADSFTFNPHKMLGAPQQTTMFLTRHEGVLKKANATGASYLFDDRKNGASFDVGDSTFLCGRKPDAIKFWTMWKYYGHEGIAKRVQDKADILDKFQDSVRKSDSFMLACEPWPFNINFFYVPKRLRKVMKERGISMEGSDPILPDDISEELAKISVTMKLKMQEAGEMLLPYQPMSTQKADCFRLVLAGKKEFTETDIVHMMSTMDKFGEDL